MAVKLALLITLSACMVAYTLAVSCYVCEQHLDSKCGDKYSAPSSHLTDCGDSIDSCSKASAVGKIGGLRFSSVNRTCGALYDNAICANEDAFPFEDPSQDITDTDVWQCTCKGDSCNTGSHVTYGLSAVLFTAFTAYLVR